MAVEKTKSKGFSTDPADAVSGGIFGPGRAKFLKTRFGIHKYKQKDGTITAKATALITTASRSGEKATLAWTVGNGFKASEDGMKLHPKDGQGGLSDSCNLYHFAKSLKENGAPKHIYAELHEDASVLDGCIFNLVTKPLAKIVDGKKDRNPDRERSVLVIDDIISAPWMKGSKKKDADDDDEEEDKDEGDEEDEDKEDEEEEEEKPKSKKKSKASDDDDEDADKDDDEDEDEDEKPAAKSKSKTKAKTKAKDEDEEEEEDEDEDADEDVDEPATEALIEALTDGPLRLSKIEAAILAVPAVKKHKQKKAIAARAADPKFLKKETGWSWDAEKKLVDLDK